jgi:hypothetical protein
VGATIASTGSTTATIKAAEAAASAAIAEDAAAAGADPIAAIAARNAAIEAAGSAESSATDAAASAAEVAPSYLSRLAFEAATVAGSVDQFTVSGLAYAVDPIGTAIESANGVKGSPLGVATPEHFGAVGDGVTNDTAAIAAMSAFTDGVYDLHGKTYYTTLTSGSLSFDYYNGEIFTVNTSSNQTLARRVSAASTDETKPCQTKCRVLDWEGKRMLALGTSITYAGLATNDGYPELSAQALGFSITNKSQAGSHTFFLAGDTGTTPDDNKYKALSMTEADRVYWAANGQTSLTDDFPYYIPSRETADYRIKAPWQLEHFDAVMLDHNHNDRRIPIGTLEPESINIVMVVTGTQTVMTLSSIGSIKVNDGVALSIVGNNGLNHAAARVAEISGSVVTLDYDSAGLSSTITSGELIKLDRTTLYGSFEFVMHYIYNTAYRWGTGSTSIILSSAPSEHTGDTTDNLVWANARALERLAAKWNVSFFDVATAYSVTAGDQNYLFPDTVHPNTAATRRALSNVWIDWLSGGAATPLNPDDFLSKGADPVAYQVSYYNPIIDGFVPVRMMQSDETVVIDDDFTGGLGAYALTGTPTVIDASYGGKAVLFERPTGVTNPYLTRSSLTAGACTRFSFDFMMPETVGLTTSTSPVTVALARVRAIGSALVWSISLIIRDSRTQLRLNYYDQPSNGGVGAIIDSVNLLAGEVNSIEVQQIRASATDNGAITFRLNGELVGRKEREDSTQDNPQSFQIGVIGGSFTGDIEYEVSNVFLGSRTPISPFSGTVESPSSITVANGIVTNVS